MTWTSGEFTATGEGEEITVEFNEELESKGVNVDIDFGAGVAEIQLERLPPNEYRGDFRPVGDPFTSTDQKVASETIQGTKYRLNCTSFTSGPISWVLGTS